MDRQMPGAWLFALIAFAGAPSSAHAQVSAPPQAIAADLLETDRAFSASSMRTDAVTGLSAQFAEDVTMPTGRTFARGKAAATAALAANADNAGARIEWTPARVAISADGRHGFTFGTMRLHKADGSLVPLKYLAYWVREAAGWRVVAYKRARRPPTATGPLAMMPAVVPDRLDEKPVDAATRARHAQELDAIERAFSDEAQVIGLAAAFARHGSADAVNMGGPDDAGFVVGAAAIGRAVGAGEAPGGSSLAWTPDRVIVADSGDLGVTIGTIRRNAPPADAETPATIPFFTIWRRAAADQPWRYIAE